ncbi:MAG: hypothetical protein HYW23_03590 [Candidatus Aenigmarchaeota archaeon]|nr:hypothetical protein [Candidatus Aenigmarchaeota archaeon]
MELDFQLLDCDYINLGNKPVVRLFGKTKDGKSVCVFFRNYSPYFYVLPKNNFEKIEEMITKKFTGLVTKIENVQKFLPKGYQVQKQSILKITLNDPSRVPEVRDSLQSEKLVEGVYEADILFKYRFMADFNISGFNWIRATGIQTRTSTVKVDIVVEATELKEIDNFRNVDLKYMSFDIETISEEGAPDPRKDIIGMISISFSPHYNSQTSLVIVSKISPKLNKNIKVFQNEKEMLQEFLQILENYDPDVLVGYNINNFDLPYILSRLKENNLHQMLGRCKQKPMISRKIGVQYRNVAVGRIIVDAYELIKESIRKGNLRLKRLGLGDVSKELLNDTKMDISHSEIFGHWHGESEQVAKLIEYARKDSDLALRLVLEKGFLDKFFELGKVSGLVLQDCLDGGEAQRVENILLKEFDKNEYVLPCKPREEMLETEEMQELKGALVLEPKIGLHTDPIVYLDFKSMYPSIFIAYNICPTTLMTNENMNVESITTPYGTKFVSKSVKTGIMPTILKKLIDERDKVRAEEKKSTEKEVKRLLEAKQIALKIMTNAFYGYTGYLRARLYIPAIANTITGCGRFLINKTKHIIEEKTGYEVVYGDTDSIMVKIKTDAIETAFDIGKNLESLVNTELTGIIQMKIEKIFKSLLILSKKRYTGLAYEKSNGEWKEDLVMKGIETVRRDWCNAATKTLFEVLNILLREQNPKKAFIYIKDYVSKLERNEIPIDDLIITKSISKSLSAYKGMQPHVELVKKMKKRNGTAPGVGDRVGFVIVKGMQLLSQRSEDPEFVTANKIPLDSKYYLESQILPPLERVFEVIGISKSELMGIGRQTLLKELFGNNHRVNGTTNDVKESIDSFDGFVCSKCNKFYRRIPLIGKCLECQGEILFSSPQGKSRNLMAYTYGNNLKV